MYRIYLLFLYVMYSFSMTVRNYRTLQELKNLFSQTFVCDFDFMQPFFIYFSLKQTGEVFITQE